MTDDRWERIGSEVLPGDFINTVTVHGDELFIGTMNLGVVIYDLVTGSLRSFDDINPELAPRNITVILPENNERIWFGTYGKGLILWERSPNTLQYFTKESGEIADNWLICGESTGTGLYFGTLGGGVSYLSIEDRQWRTIGLVDGLPALNVVCITYRRPYVYFGTLGSGVSLLHEVSYVQEF